MFFPFCLPTQKACRCRLILPHCNMRSLKPRATGSSCKRASVPSSLHPGCDPGSCRTPPTGWGQSLASACLGGCVGGYPLQETRKPAAFGVTYPPCDQRPANLAATFEGSTGMPKDTNLWPCNLEGLGFATSGCLPLGSTSQILDGDGQEFGYPIGASWFPESSFMKAPKTGSPFET